MVILRRKNSQEFAFQCDLLSCTETYGTIVIMSTLQVRVEDNLHRDFRIVCAALGVTMSEQLKELMQSFIAENRDKVKVSFPKGAPKKRGS